MFHREGARRARRWVWHIDNILRHHTTFGGYDHFKYNDEDSRWHHWSTWPYMFIAMDLGSDGVAGVHWMMGLGDCCLDFAGDESHSGKTA